MSELFTLAGKQIDGVLRLVGSVEPRNGFEQRLMASIASETRALALTGKSRAWFFGRLSNRAKAGGLILAFGLAAAAVMVSAAIHKDSGSIPASPAVSFPTQQRPSGGFGSASVSHVPSLDIESQGNRDSRVRGTQRAHKGRATLRSLQRHGAHGTAAPDSPYPRPE